LAIYAFVGFEVGVVPAGEARDPRRDFPFALFVGLLVVTAIYLVVQIVAIGTLPDLATSERPLADAAAHFIGPAGAAIISVGAIISVLGNLNVGLLAGSRLLFAMSERNELPRVFARTHPTFRTPTISLVVKSLIIFVMTVESSFISAVAIATITRLLVYATTCLALPVFRKRKEVPAARFRVPMGIAAAVLSLGLLTSVDFAKEGVSLAIWLSIGLLIFAAMRFFNRDKIDDGLGEDAVT
jgi:APA family basic amino acid/polyamine antiporter